MQEIEVSVLCITYNQEKYIRQCLEGFVMQKTNFPFEVIINDDASTDKTPEIIKEYANKYPKIIKPIYQKENQYSKGIDIFCSLIFPKAKGKYLAFCEGDDFWTDENKLQIQYDIMEKNPKCHLCLHKVRNINESGQNLNSTCPNFNLKEKMMYAEEFLKLMYPVIKLKINSYFVRKEDYKNYINDFINIIKIYREYGVGDIPLSLYFGQLNEIYYINKIMSKYRSNSLGSWSSKNKEIPINTKIHKYMLLIKAMDEFDKYTAYKYHSFCERKIFLYSLKIAKIIPNKKNTLLNRKEFFGRFNLLQKSFLLMHVLFPNLATQLRKIYRNFKY